MLPSQILLSTIIIFIIYKTIFSYRQKKLTKTFFVIWISFWIGVLVIILQTKILSKLARFVGIGRGVDLAIYLSIISLFYIVFRIYVRINNLEKKLTKIARKQAFNNVISKSRKRRVL